MANEDKLSVVLSEFARTLITDFPIQGILDHLVQRIVGVLPVTSAGVTLISPGKAPHFIAASDDDALRFERLQTELGQGPCLAAYESGEAVAVPDLAVDDRFPLFAPAAVAAGLRAVFTFPLCHAGGSLGALDLYRDTPGGLDPSDMDAAQTLADVAAAYLLNAQAREEARATSDRFHHRALHDPLTGLPNRTLFQERLEHAALRARRSHSNAAVLFVDLDEFKAVNDTHGHHVGDGLLLAVAQRLSGLIRSGDTLARFSGDEFVFLCEDLRGSADAEILAKRINATLANPFMVAGNEVVVAASVGIAFAGHGEDISNQLVVEADRAMYAAKRKGGGGHQIIDLRDVSRRGSGESFEADLRVALDEDRLDVAYQPIVTSADGLVIGVEALLRWTHPKRGPIAPLAMVAIAEQSDLINDIGGWVLARACRDHRRWGFHHPGVAFDLAVNVSVRQLMQPGFCATVADVLNTAGVDPSALILEVTETIFIEDDDRVMTVLTDLKGLGIRLALDDFGTGYSSLSSLGRFPIDIVKIDRCFITDVGATPGRTIVAAVTKLAHDLGLVVIAEGVETADQRHEIRTIGCDYAQGYLYARPMPADAITALRATPPSEPVHLPPVDLARIGSRPNHELIDTALGVVTAWAAVTVHNADGVSIALERNGRMTTVAASNDTVLRMDSQQYDTGEGPCLAAAAEGRQCHSGSLAEETQWPVFAPLAFEQGINSILSSPLMSADRPLGALNIYSTTANAFGTDEQHVAAQLAAQASGILIARGADVTDEKSNVRLTDALAARESIAQAQGMLMAGNDITAEAATLMLYRSARAAGVTARQYAAQIVAAVGNHGSTDP